MAFLQRISGLIFTRLMIITTVLQAQRAFAPKKDYNCQTLLVLMPNYVKNC